MWACLACVLLAIGLTASEIVYLTTTNRAKRSADDNSLEIRLEHKNSDFAILLRQNELLVTDDTVVEWHFGNGTKSTAKLGKGLVSQRHLRNCFYIGEVKNC